MKLVGITTVGIKGLEQLQCRVNAGIVKQIVEKFVALLNAI